MATKQLSSPSEALEKLQDQLTCPICLEHLTYPKTLPCLHSFCHHCLQAVPLDLVRSKYLLTCPSCRSSSELPETGVAGLTTAFLVNNLIEVYGLLKKVSVAGDVSCDNCEKSNAVRYCKECGLFYCKECLHYHNKLKSNTDHSILGLDEVASTAYQLTGVKEAVSQKCSSHDKPLDIYCETCEELVCHLCTVRIHKDHDYDVVSDAYSKHRQALEDNLQPLKKQIVRISEGLKGLIQRRNEITQQGEKVKEDIGTAIQRIVEQVQETGRRLRKEVELAVKVKVGVVNVQVKQAETALGQATECLDHIQQGLKVGTPQQVLSSKAQMRDRLQSIISLVEKEKFEPLEKADVTLKKSKQIDQISNNIGNVQYSSFPSKVQVSKKHLPLVGRESTCTISLSSSNGSPVPVPSSPISCYLSPPDDHQPVECRMEESRQSGEYKVTFTPISRGPHQMHVRVGGNDISNSPVSIPVSVPPEKRGTPVKIITGLKRPFGVDVTEDGLVIAGERSGDCVTILNRKGEKVRCFGCKGTGKGQFNEPRGVAVTSRGTILVVDCRNHRIQEFTMEGQCISCVGGYGNSPLQFLCPFGIAVNKITGQVFVADSANNRIQVLNPDLSFSHVFGSKGSKEGQFDFPFDVTVDDTGAVYVADTNNDRIQQWTPEGRFVSMFETKGKKPIGIVSVDGVIYVSQKDNNSISMYTASGECIGSIAIVTPQHLAVDTSGYLYCCGMDRVVIV